MNKACLVIIAVVCLGCAQTNPQQEEWISLFNGKDLTGWDVKISGHPLNENFGNTFRVDSGKLVVRYDLYDSFRNQYGHIFYRQKFSHYRLRVEYRFVGSQAVGGEGWATRNSGVMLHAQSAETMRLAQDFPISVEAQFLGGLGQGDRHTANLCTPGTHVFMADTLFTPHCISSRSKTYHGDQWVSVEFLVLGDSLIQHLVEDEVVMEYTKPHIGGGVVSHYDSLIKVDGTPLLEGFIALQSESHPVEIRKIELLELKGCMDPKAINFKSYFIEANNIGCRY